MINKPFSVRRKIILIRHYNGIGITSKLEAYFIANAEWLPARFYNGRIAYQYKALRIGLTILRKQARCRIELIVEEPMLPF